MCFTPYITTTGQPVPCGSCILCYKTRAAAWSFRLLIQQRVSESALFVTLTYNERCLPYTDDEYDLPTLNRKHVKDYFKRLRQAHARAGCTKTIKYYCVGEYGKKSSRPHYHAIIYNARPDLIQSCWTLSYTSSKHDRIPAGNVHIDECNMATICYTTQYLFKGKTVPNFKGDPRQREFANMSKCLGVNYLTETIIKYHGKSIERNYVTLPGGNKMPLCRYYKEKIYTEAQRKELGERIQMRHQIEFRENVKRSGLSHTEYTDQQNKRRMEHMRLLKRREDLKIWKL